MKCSHLKLNGSLYKTEEMSKIFFGHVLFDMGLVSANI